MKRVSIRDVAKLAGVSPAAVSRYINSSGYLSAESRRRIRQAIQELDYTPNELARNLYNNKSGVIAVLVPDSGHPFFSEFVREAESVLQRSGYRVLLCNTYRARDEDERQFFDMLKRRMVDGIITGVHTLDNVLEYAEMTQPIVALDRQLGDQPLVASNHPMSGMLAAKRLLDRGCRKVLQFHGSPLVSTPAFERSTAFASYMRVNGAEVIDWPMEWNDFTFDCFQKNAWQACDAHPDVDGAFGTDLSIACFLQRALMMGRRVPEDLKLVACDGTGLTRITTPRLTVVSQPIHRLAEEATGLLLRRIAGEDLRGTKLILDVTLEEGGTA